MKQQTNKPFLTVLGSCVLMMTLCSCHLEGEDIGDLYGRWKLVSIDDSQHLSVQPELIYISFQADVYQYQPNWQYDWGTYEKSETELTINPLSYRSGFGFKDLMNNETYDGSKPVVFHLDLLSDKRMILSRNDTLWVFKKFIE